jgi:hypothetical protein
MVKPSFKYAVQMGVLVKAGKTATKTLKTCHVEMKDIVHKKKLVPAVTSSMLRKGLDKLCFRTKFDGYRALKIALQAGLFKTGRRP